MNISNVWVELYSSLKHLCQLFVSLSLDFGLRLFGLFLLFDIFEEQPPQKVCERQTQREDKWCHNRYVDATFERPREEGGRIHLLRLQQGPQLLLDVARNWLGCCALHHFEKLIVYLLGKVFEWHALVDDFV